MSDDKPFLITPPPGLLPERRRDESTDDAPVQTGSATRRLEAPRRPPAVGVPLPGAAAAAAPAPVAEPVTPPAPAAPAASPVAPAQPGASVPPVAAPVPPSDLVFSPFVAPSPELAPEPVIDDPVVDLPADDATVLRSDVVPVAQVAGDTVLVSTNRERRWVVEFSDGTRVTIAPGGLIVGRDPIGFPHWPLAELVHLDDPGRSVSKTHAVIQPEGDGVRVVDLGSTNGVNRIVDELRVPVPTQAGALVADGAVLEFGSLIGTVRRV